MKQQTERSNNWMNYLGIALVALSAWVITQDIPNKTRIDVIFKTWLPFGIAGIGYAYLIISDIIEHFKQRHSKSTHGNEGITL